MPKPKRPEWSFIKLPVELTSRIDAWALVHGMARPEATQHLVELALSDPASGAAGQRDDRAIERLAEVQIEMMIDPDTPTEERERRIHRLTEGPPEFVDLRRDLPRHRRTEG